MSNRHLLKSSPCQTSVNMVAMSNVNLVCVVGYWVT